ncbi:MAG: PEGA domain-containing protein [Alphaproteobacteria bacterium]
MRFITVGGVIVAAALLPACATITRGTSQKFAIESVPSQADVKLSTGQTCVTPCTLTLKRKSQFKVTVSKEGYKTEERDVHGKVKGGGAAGVAGNVIFGGVIGAGVDVASGAALSLEPNPLQVTLVPIDQPVAAEPATELQTPSSETNAIPAANGLSESPLGNPAASDDTSTEEAPATTDDETAASASEEPNPSL